MFPFHATLPPLHGLHTARINTCFPCNGSASSHLVSSFTSRWSTRSRTVAFAALNLVESMMLPDTSRSYIATQRHSSVKHVVRGLDFASTSPHTLPQSTKSEKMQHVPSAVQRFPLYPKYGDTTAASISKRNHLPVPSAPLLSSNSAT